jgi:hypothetical protein
MCFVRVSEQTVIIFLNSISWLAFVMKTECVFYKVQTEFLYII